MQKSNIMKKFIILIKLVCINQYALWACNACEKQQPKITQGITHGAGPDSNWDWLIVAVICAITLITFCLSLKYLIKPLEQNSNHIKRLILTQ